MDTKSLPGGLVDVDDAHVIDLTCAEDEAELAWFSRYMEFHTDIKSDDPFKTSIKEDDDDVFRNCFWFHSIDYEIVDFYPRRKVVTSSTSVEIIKQADIYKYDPCHLPKYSALRDYMGSFTKRGRKFRNILRPNRVTGSGFWKATGIDMPIHASNVKTGSANNRRETLQTHSSILDSMEYHQWQQYGLLTNVGPGYRSGYGYNSSGGETSTTRHHSYVPQVHVDIFNEIDQIMVENGNNGHTYLAIYQAWNEYKNRLKISKFDDDAMKMMSGIFVAVAGQFVAGVMANRLTSSASSSSWAAPIVELATVFGLCVTLLGISLRAKSRSLSTLMIKIGAVTTAWAIIFSMGSHLPPVMAWTVGPVAFLIMALAAAFA